MEGKMAKEFSFAIMICSQRAKLAAYETTGYLHTLLSVEPEYKARTPVWPNLRTLASLVLPAPPWVGLPICHAFGITWSTVKRLVSGAIGIATVKVKGGL
jgi:hypothetical protein